MLTIGLDAKKKEPLYQQIYLYIRNEIKSGALPIESKLPSARRLAKHMEVSRNTVDLAYAQLVAEGYIESKPKRGFFVCQVEELAQLDITVENLDEEVEEKIPAYAYDFSSAGVDMEQFPYNTWRKLLKEVLIDDNREIFQKGMNQGDLELRQAIMYYLRQSRGVNVQSSQIVIGSGMENLLFLLRQIMGKNQTIGIENPVYMNAHSILKQLEFGICPISMDEGGMRVDELEKSDADIAYVTPAHQYPTGVVLPIRRRNQLMKWALGQENRYIIEDDYDSEFRYHGKPIPALQGIDKSGKIIYMGTFSKAIAPAIRVSYMVLPKGLLPKYQEAAKGFSCSVSRIDQAVLTSFLSNGYFERHLNRMRTLYKDKHDCMVSLLKEIDHPVTIHGQGAGAHVLVDFHIKNHEQFQKELEKVSVKIYPLSQYYIEGKPKEEQYILGFTRMKKEDMIEGIKKIKQILLFKE